MANKPRPIYYDTETTGIRNDKDRIIELAAYDPIENRTFCHLINPGMPIPKEATAIHNISDEMGAPAPSLQRIVCDRGRPVELLEHFAIGDNRHVRIDQRCPAQPGALDHRDVLVVQQLKQAERIEVAAGGPEHALDRLRIIAGRPFLPALEDAHRWFGIQIRGGQAGRCNGAAVTRADDDKIVAGLPLFPGC